MKSTVEVLGMKVLIDGVWCEVLGAVIHDGFQFNRFVQDANGHVRPWENKPRIVRARVR